MAIDTIETDVVEMTLTGSGSIESMESERVEMEIPAVTGGGGSGSFIFAY